MSQLRDLGIVRFEGGLDRGQGRPAAKFELLPEGFAILTLVIRPDGSELHLVDAFGSVRHSLDIPVIAEDDYDEAVERFSSAIRRTVDEVRGSFAVLVGLGIVFDGSVDRVLGRIRTPSRFPGWHGRSIVQDLEDRTGIQCVVENDATSLVSGLLWFRQAALPKDFAVIKVDLGLGAAFSFERQVYAGSDNVPPGIAHTTALSAGSRACHCGRTGCLETELSIPAVLSRARDLGLWNGPTGRSRHAFQRLLQTRAGDAHLDHLLEETGELAARIADTIGRTLNLSAIVFAGDLLHHAETAWSALSSGLAQERDSGSVVQSWWHINEVLPQGNVEAIAGAGAVLDGLNARSEVLVFSSELV